MIALLTYLLICHETNAILYPRNSISREQISLDGVWDFKTSPSLDPQKGFREKWYEKALTSPIEMPVPSSVLSSVLCPAEAQIRHRQILTKIKGTFFIYSLLFGLSLSCLHNFRDFSRSSFVRLSSCD